MSDTPPDESRERRRRGLHRLPWEVGRVLGRTVLGAGRLVLPRPRKATPGSAPGIEADQLATMPRSKERVPVTCTDYSPDHVQQHQVDDLDAFLDADRPSDVKVRWINVDGLGDPYILRSLAQHYRLHPLAIEDVLHVPQRAKVETFELDGEPAPMFVVARMLQLHERHLQSEQLSIFLTKDTVITLQQRPGDVFDPIRQRLQRPEARLRQQGADFLLYALIDAAIDSCFPILERYSDALESLDQRIIEDEDRRIPHETHGIKHELMLMRREMWPMRELANALERSEEALITKTTRFYLRDVSDHATQAIDLIETYREIAMALVDRYMSAISNRMNEVMKVLTMIATIFIPLSFLAGVYGMNFAHMPELDESWAYPVWWGLCIALTAGMLLFFRRKRWL